MNKIELSSRAERDLKGLPAEARGRVVDGLRRLAAGDDNLNVDTLTGRAPWRRLRLGDFRVLYRPIEGGVLVARIINRRDLERAVKELRDPP